MMVGHALLAFALVAGGLRSLGRDPRRALVLGVVAAAFAAVPDVDMVYALSGLAAVDPGLVVTGGIEGLFVVTESFWGASTVVHRSATHSVVLAVPVAVALAAWATGRTAGRSVALAILAGVTGVAWGASGTVDAAVVGLFCVAALSVAHVVARTTDVDPRTLALTALVGFGTHPFGDLFTGEPPRLLYPLEAHVLTGRVEFAGDPTLHLLGAFALELAVIWLALVVYLWVTGGDSTEASSDPIDAVEAGDRDPVARSLGDRLSTRFGDRSPGRFVGRSAPLAAGYGTTVLLFQPPTLEVSYHFVFSLLLVGVLLALPALGRPSGERIRAAIRDRGVDPETPLSLVVTGLVAVSIGWVAYLVAYLAL